MLGNGHVRFGPEAVGKGPAPAGTSPTAYRYPGRWSGTAGGMARTPCGWQAALRDGAHDPRRPRSGSTSTTARRSSTPGCAGRARCWASSWSTPDPASPPAEARSNGCFAPCATSSWSRSPTVRRRAPAAAVASLAELNALFTAWVEQVYHRRVHRETGMAPLARLPRARPTRADPGRAAGRGVPLG